MAPPLPAHPTPESEDHHDGERDPKQVEDAQRQPDHLQARAIYGVDF
jgi:hypothetical protein